MGVEFSTQDFVEFSEAVLKDPEGRPIKFAAMHLAIIAHMQYCWERGLGAGINAPLGHGKTTCALGIPLFEIANNVNIRIKFISATDVIARDRTAAIRSYIDEDPDYRRLCPHVAPSRRDRAESRKRLWAGNKLFVQRTSRAVDATLEAKGLLSTGVGGRADLMCFEDPIDEKNSRSEAGRLAVQNKIEKEWIPRLEPDGRILWISTPYHHQDMNFHLRKNPRFCFLVMAISADYSMIDAEVLNAPDREHPLRRIKKS